MIRGLYTASSAMFANLRQQELVANNLSNLQTPGYKAQIGQASSFEMVMVRQIRGASGPIPQRTLRTVGVVGTGVYMQDQRTDLAQGPVRLTEEPLDLAINGSGFFAVQAGDGVVYTRNGHFSRDGQDRLVTVDSMPVLGIDGRPIVIGGDTIAISNAGEVSVDGQAAGTIQVVDIDEGDLTRAGDTAFVAAALQGSPLGAGTLLQQGALEEANIDIGRTMTQVVSLQQQFQASQRVFTLLAENLLLTVRDVGRVG